MEDAEAEVEKSETESRIEKAIEKEITKLRYNLEPGEEMIENEDCTEMEITVKLSTNITDKISDLISVTVGGNQVGSGNGPFALTSHVVQYPPYWMTKECIRFEHKGIPTRQA